MLYASIIVGLIFILIGYVIHNDCVKYSSLILVFVFTLSFFLVICEYNSTKSTVDKQIEVLEERNELVIKQIEPLVDKYLNYENDTYKGLKLDANMIVSLANYPQLKGNEFVESQIQIILKNQEEITKLKLDKVKLNSYKLWIFMGE